MENWRRTKDLLPMFYGGLLHMKIWSDLQDLAVLGVVREWFSHGVHPVCYSWRQSPPNLPKDSIQRHLAKSLFGFFGMKALGQPNDDDDHDDNDEGSLASSAVVNGRWTWFVVNNLALVVTNSCPSSLRQSAWGPERVYFGHCYL